MLLNGSLLFAVEVFDDSKREVHPAFYPLFITGGKNPQKTFGWQEVAKQHGASQAIF